MNVSTAPTGKQKSFTLLRQNMIQISNVSSRAESVANEFWFCFPCQHLWKYVSCIFVCTHCLCLGIWLCSWNATYESLLGSSKPFPQPIPLPVRIIWFWIILQIKIRLFIWLACRLLILTGNDRFSSGHLGTGGPIWLNYMTAVWFRILEIILVIASVLGKRENFSLLHFVHQL